MLVLRMTFLHLLNRLAMNCSPALQRVMHWFSFSREDKAHCRLSAANKKAEVISAFLFFSY
jgi:hypothetical protein